MHFSSLLAMAALAVAAPVVDNGYWHAIYKTSSFANGYQSRNVNATYHNSKLPGGKPVNVLCSYVNNPSANPPESSSCTDKSFTYSYDGENLALAQTVKLRGKKTRVSGSGPIVLKPDNEVGKSFTGKGNVKVSKAVPA